MLDQNDIKLLNNMFDEKLRDNINMVLEEMDNQTQRIYNRMNSMEKGIREHMAKNKNELSHEINALNANCDCIPIMMIG